MTALDGAATLRLETERLVLLALTAEFVEALKDRSAAERLFRAAIPDGLPHTELGGLLQIYGPWIAEDAGRLATRPTLLRSASSRRSA
jgi:hypothetical protein